MSIFIINFSGFDEKSNINTNLNNKQTKEPVEGPAEEPIEEPAEEPIEEPAEEPIEEPEEEPEEEYYMIRRRIDIILDKKIKKKPYNETLSLLNKLFKTEYKRLLDVKNIKMKYIPKRKQFVKILQEHIKMESDFDMIYDKKLPTHIIINNILSKIGYSFICKKENNKLRFGVKAYSYSYII